MSNDRAALLPRLAWWIVMLAALLWSVLCGALHIAGHTPSGPTPLQPWYAIQAVVVWGVVPLQAWIVGRVTARVTRLSDPARPIGVAAWGTTVLCFVGSDLVAWALVDFDELGRVLLVTGPLSLVFGLGVGVVRLRTLGSPAMRSVGALLLGYLAAVVVGGPFLR